MKSENEWREQGKTNESSCEISNEEVATLESPYGFVCSVLLGCDKHSTNESLHKISSSKFPMIDRGKGQKATFYLSVCVCVHVYMHMNAGTYRGQMKRSDP